MSRTSHDPADPCIDPSPNGAGCPRPPLERLEFWDGQFLMARDLRDQQEHLIRRLQYHQRAAHGEGILCGFGIAPHPREKCRTDWVVVEPGMGYDCCGRTLWSSSAQVVRVPNPEQEEHEKGEEEHEDGENQPDQPPPVHGHKPEPDQEQEQQGPSQHGTPGREYPPDYEDEKRQPEPEWFIKACYAECRTEQGPALYVDDLCNPIRQRHSRVREEVRIYAVPASEVSDDCWPRRKPHHWMECSDPVEDDCHDRMSDTPPCNPHCACGECLVLAAVWRDRRTGELRWSTGHRKILEQTGNLTRITGISWPHGGELSIEDLLRKHDARLRVHFSRRLREAVGEKNGINRMTFTVSFLGPSKAYEQIIPPEVTETHGRPPSPRLSRNGRCAIFDLDRDMLTGRLGYAGNYLHIRLLCDFLIDCHGRAVSGAHLAGEANVRGSGNGVQGGVFESWFYLRSAWRGEQR